MKSAHYEFNSDMKWAIIILPWATANKELSTLAAKYANSWLVYVPLETKWNLTAPVLKPVAQHLCQSPLINYTKQCSALNVMNICYHKWQLVQKQQK